MTDASGTVVWDADYKPFGEVTITLSTITNNLRFPGQYFDAETGTHYNYYRDYNPSIGRYVEADPLGIEKGINHLYAYVANNPLNITDPLGLGSDCSERQKCIDTAVKTRQVCTKVAWGSQAGCTALCAAACAAVPGYVECFVPCTVACHAQFAAVRKVCWAVFLVQVNGCYSIPCKKCPDK
jgi:RHS repeat-associated protein